MVSINTLAGLARAYNNEVASVSAAAVDAIDSALLIYSLNAESFPQFVKRLNSTVRAAYISSGGLAVQYAEATYTEYDLKLGTKQVKNSAYLKALTEDVKRNAQTFWDSPRGLDDIRRLRFRTELSARTAAERGFTDSQIASFASAAKAKYAVRKVWMADWDSHTPCDHCAYLHGKNLPYDMEFRAEQHGSVAIYQNLMGPPRHPFCRCALVFYIVSLQTPEGIEAEKPDVEEPQSLTFAAIRAMSEDVYDSVRKVLTAIIKKFRGGRSGN